MDKFRAWISARPVLGCFAIAYALSWPLFVLVTVIVPRNMVLQGTLGSLAVFAPALAAMIVAAVLEPQRTGGRGTARLATFLAVWTAAAATLVLFVWRVRGAPVGAGVAVFAAVLALLPAFVASRAFSQTVGIRRHFNSLARPRGNIVWYLVALLAFPAVQLAGVGITRLFGSGAGSSSELQIAVDPATAALLFLHGFFFAGGINEESGWRGFALARLQRRFCPLAAGLIVWVFWALWHLPMDLASDDSAAPILTNRVLFNAMWSILFMWVFNRTGGSLLAPALFHPAMNASGTLLPRTDAATGLFVLLTAAAILSARMWRRLPPTHSASAGSDNDKA